MSHYLEIEQKFDAPDQFVLPDLTDLPGRPTVAAPQSLLLVADYYDTEDLRLAARGITLRRRRGGQDDGWHLKLPAGRDARLELREPLGPKTIPARLADVVAATTRGERLQRVAKLETRRTTIKLLDPDGETLAEIADDSVRGTLPGTHRPPVSWHEIEVEVGPAGSSELLKAAGKRLRQAGARRSDAPSKLSRVLGPPAQETPVFEDGTAGAVAVQYLAAQVRALLTFDPKARLAEPDAVHKMRVAVRRTRSILRSHRRILDRERTDALQPELRWLAAELGEVRDLEVLRERFTARLDALPDEVARNRAWLDALATREQAAYKGLNRTLASRRYFAVLDAMEALIADPPFTKRASQDAKTELRKIVKRAWRRLENAYAAAEKAADPQVARHEARKDAKRARYAAEAAVPALGDKAETVARGAERLQEIMGGYQDGVIAQRYLATAAAEAPPEEAFTIGVVWGVEQAAALASLEEIPTVWDEVNGANGMRAVLGK